MTDRRAARLRGSFQKAILVIASRLLFGGIGLLTSFYCLLAFVPFTYTHFLQFPHFSWLVFFVRFHPPLYLVSLALVAATLIADLDRPRSRNRALAFLLPSSALGVVLLIDPLLASLPNDGGSLL